MKIEGRNTLLNSSVSGDGHSGTRILELLLLGIEFEELGEEIELVSRNWSTEIMNAVRKW